MVQDDLDLSTTAQSFVTFPMLISKNIKKHRYSNISITVF